MASGQDGKRAPNYPARDARAEHGGPGFGAKPKPRGQPKARAQPIRQQNKVKLGGPDCTLCTGLCCGVARALMEEAFGLGANTLSPKVSKGICCWFVANFPFVFQAFDKALRNAYAHAQALRQGGGDREGLGVVRATQVFTLIAIFS